MGGVTYGLDSCGLSQALSAEVGSDRIRGKIAAGGGVVVAVAAAFTSFARILGKVPGIIPCLCSGLATDCDRVFPDELRVSSFL